jgi:TetR/AcrR family transcriptional regulator, transcriptional repressor for nem operon
VESRQGMRRGPKPKLDTRSNLVEAGLQMIHAEGYAATGVQSIVECADVPKGSFYNYFASKEAFGVEVIAAYSDRGLARLRDFLSKPEVSPLPRLEAYFDARIKALKSSNYAGGCLLGNFSAEVADHSADT